MSKNQVFNVYHIKELKSVNCNWRKATIFINLPKRGGDSNLESYKGDVANIHIKQSTAHTVSVTVIGKREM